MIPVTDISVYEGDVHIRDVPSDFARLVYAGQLTQSALIELESLLLAIPVGWRFHVESFPYVCIGFRLDGNSRIVLAVTVNDKLYPVQFIPVPESR